MSGGGRKVNCLIFHCCRQQVLRIQIIAFVLVHFLGGRQVEYILHTETYITIHRFGGLRFEGHSAGWCIRLSSDKIHF